ncbi:M14 family zinc carboxypeptidase [Hamadaea tsunoensis]|uniref:M14 family zinc carboxypeptidase n=1 Tax=Hamadaea tsunoensis TaxID=53368 RepID=UPI000429E3E9|nr:M14 family zinc carboxypeptidase [Hamadaea tsunoensis]
MLRRFAVLLSTVALGLGTLTATTTTAHAGPPDRSGTRVSAYKMKSGETAVALARKVGAEISTREPGFTMIRATADQAERLRGLGIKLEGGGVASLATGVGTPVDPGYTTYAQMLTAFDGIATAFPGIAAKQVIGHSAEGRDLVALKISDNVATDENEPEVLFTANQHAREHLTVEMAIALAGFLTGQYAINPDVQKMVNSREIWIIPMVNPDGVSFDMVSGLYQMWRKNRQATPGSTEIGTDLNRNWGYKFACCAGSSPFPTEEDYRGPSAFSAPETQAVRDFVLSRRVGGVQQITEAIDIHTFTELVLWPFGYTTKTTVTGTMSADEYATHKAIGTEFAMLNGYTPGQASGLYITDGSIDDWLWGTQKIYTFTTEMYPKENDPDAFYPPSSVISAQTSRNIPAIMRFLGYADCPQRAIGKEGTYCKKTDDYTLTAPATATVAQGADVTVALTATKTTGAAQLVSMTAEGTPPGATVTFSTGSIPTDGSAQSATIHTSATTTPGTYTVVLVGNGTAGTVRTARVTLTVTGTAACAGGNATRLTIPDGTSTFVSNTVTIAACGGNAGTTARVDLDVTHTHIGDLEIALKSPTGTRFVLHALGTGADLNDIKRSYTVDLSGEAADGAWTLEAEDVTGGDSGRVNSWTLTLK